ncbi:hypothetical protein AAHA92_15550 [Salvia divinorum]|uniref:Myb/SANT-like domain-containing protein n=1 Tax=Salvia divinorum TaxID=28513 RepID=A0ABD1HF48_SALDI
MGTKIPRQALFFYKSNWTVEADSMMLSVVVNARNKTGWGGSVIPINVLEEAADAMTAGFSVPFTWRDLYIHFQFFEQRYIAFKVVLDTSGVIWDMHSNVVTTEETVWKEIIKKNNLGATYYYSMEPEFLRLKFLFGPQGLKQESNSDVIVISDTTIPVEDENEEKHQTEWFYDMTAAMSESVNSPLLVNAPKMRRKLFVSDGYGQLSNETMQLNNERDSEEELVPKLEKRFPLRTKKRRTTRPLHPMQANVVQHSHSSQYLFNDRSMLLSCPNP